ncbi:WSC-domain-containing protein [Trametes punicea]|nr:WSC-domain-containing protein [Trametes punicea]
MLARILSFVTLVAVANAYWTFGATPVIVQTRLDSIVSPDAIGSHVHAIAGASGFSNHYDYDQLIQSNCTTVPVQSDKSNYWAPQMYHRDKDTGEFVAMPTSFNIYYLPRPGPKNESIKAFPKGFRMLAGDTFRRTYNASSFADQAITYVCLADNNPPEASPMPTQQCPGGLRAQVFFPSCWDGVNLDSPDHQSHVAYPIQAFNTGDCPDTHPVHLISLFYEMGVDVGQFDYHGNGTWVLANGDTTGFGLHADFQNGWDVGLLQQAIDECSGQSGNLLDCAPLAAVYDPDAAAACVFEGDLVDEPTGVTSPIAALPGCNPVYGSGVDPSSCAGQPTPGLVPAQPPLPEGWTGVGCIAEGTSGRALAALTMSAPNMTKELCASFCGSHGFTLAGAEYSDECYCDDALRNGATGDLLPWTECANRCAGNDFEICGGGAKLTLMTHSGSAHSNSSQSSRRVAARFEKDQY